MSAITIETYKQRVLAQSGGSPAAKAAQEAGPGALLPAAGAVLTTVKPGKPASIAKQRMTVTLPVELLERLRNVVYWTPGLTLARLIEDAVTDTIEAMEKRNHGEPFPRRIAQLKGGRPRGLRAVPGRFAGPG
jgi:hypothetical protein